MRTHAAQRFDPALPLAVRQTAPPLSHAVMCPLLHRLDEGAAGHAAGRTRCAGQVLPAGRSAGWLGWRAGAEHPSEWRLSRKGSGGRKELEVMLLGRR